MSYRGPGVPLHDLRLRPGSTFRTVSAFPVPAWHMEPEALGRWQSIYSLAPAPGSFVRTERSFPIKTSLVAREAYAFGLGQTGPTPADVADARLAMSAGIPVPVLRAIRSVESGASPSAIRFEPTLFRRDAPQHASQIPYTPSTATGGPSHVAAETNRAAFEHAFSIDPAVAVRSTSFGSYQVLGGYLLRIVSDPQAAVRAFDADPTTIGARMFAAWMQASPAARTYARSARFGSFACAYNGCCGRGHPCVTGCANCDHYAGRMQAAYDVALPAWRAIESQVQSMTGIATPQPWPTWAPWAIGGGIGAVVLGGLGLGAWAFVRHRRRAA